MAEGQSIPPAWYPDPADSAKLRYWDGENWTEKLIDRASAAAVMPSLFSPPPVDEPAPVVATGQFHRPTGPIEESPFSAANWPQAPTDSSHNPFATSEPSLPFGAVGYTPLSRAPAEPVAAPRMRRPHTGTVAIWLWTLTPLLLLVRSMVLDDMAADESVALALYGVLVVAYPLLSILLAAIDRYTLKRRGYSAPTALLGAIGPIYAIARVFSVGAGGLLVLFTALLVQSTVAAVLVFNAQLPDVVPQENPAGPLSVSSGLDAPFTPEQVAYLLTPEGMAAKLVYDAQGTDLDYQTVECAPLAALDLGTQTTCTATGRVADYSIVVQVLPDNVGVPFTVMSVAPQPH